MSALEYALFYLSKGLSVIPLRYGEKSPIVKWEEFQKRRMSEDEARRWFGKCNIGIVCGSVSQNLFVIDFDDAQVYESVMNKILSDPKLYSKLTSWIVRTGKGLE
jgi:hypothetical protein